MNLIDYHCHTKLCRHATGTINEYQAHAKNIGLRGIGFSDHFPNEFLRDIFGDEILKGVPLDEYAMSNEELPLYLQMVKTLRSRFQTTDFEIKLGLELDYVQGHEEMIGKLIAPHLDDLDYIYGSIHLLHVDGKVFPFDDSRFMKMYGKFSIDRLHRIYFETLNKLVLSGIYDIVAHLDLLKKFNIRPKDNEQYKNLVDETLTLIKESGMAVELNTAGLRKLVREIYPEKFILEGCYERGIPLVLGSDAHAPEEVGHEFERARALLLEIGFEKYVNFSKRKKIHVRLET